MRSRKVGSEDAIVVRVPTGRFADRRIPAHHDLPRDEVDRVQLMLLAQDCTLCSFGDGEVGPTQELHLWLQVDSAPDHHPIEGADLMLPSMRWVTLCAATSNPAVDEHLRSFGFDPIRVASVTHRTGGGCLQFPDHQRIEWTIEGPGRGPAPVGVRHTMVMPDDGPDAVGHAVTALIADAVLGAPGELRVHTTALEPFLLANERLPAVVHRLPKLRANIVWQRRPTSF